MRAKSLSLEALRREGILVVMLQCFIFRAIGNQILSTPYSLCYTRPFHRQLYGTKRPLV